MKYSIKSVVAALKESNGMISPAARSLNCSQTTIKNYRKKYPEVEQAIQDHRTAFVDTAELALNRSVLEGNITAIIFALKTLGKDRGFIEKQQVEHSGDMKPVINIQMEPPSTTYEIDDPESTTDTQS